MKMLHINIPFVETMEKMSTSAKFMKELITKKMKFPKEERVEKV